MTLTSATQRGREQAAEKNAIRPFHVNVPEAELTELRRRVAAARLPERETVTDFSQGVPLATTQKLAQYWQKEYDWRRCEARLNAVPNFITEIDGLDIHFIHVRSKHENALPVLISHGWPGSIVEQLKLIEPLTNPTAHGGTAADAFHVVIPSMPGYGFSGKPTETGWGPERMARGWNVLMKRLGYTSYVAQGGDWGSVVVDYMGVQAPRDCWASTATCLAWYRQRSTPRLLPARRCQPDFPRMKSMPTSSWRPFIRRSTTPSSWARGRKP